ncbi:MAG: family 1 glycosylhydrolase, partial [Chloroflexi bacterium]|nr:family 1 glycosylhydrolase [Chloroflexota bacterium]
SPEDALLAAHHALLAHGSAVPALRRHSAAAQVGITLDMSYIEAATTKPVDLEAAARIDAMRNRWFLDPVLRGRYPADGLELAEEYLPDIQPGDMNQIHVPIDFLGVNYYSREVISDDPSNPYLQFRREQTDSPRTAMDWEVYPHGLYATLKRVHTEYNPPAIYITESGAAFADTPSEDGRVHDVERMGYLRDHFRAAQHAINDGVPLKGYFVWSLMDNFEWAEGYDKRFGICYVDFATQQRSLKDSAHFMAQVAAANAIPADA